MLLVDNLPLGAYQTNCYIVREDGAEECIIIDPGAQAERLLSRMKSLGLTARAILLTHGHFDHVGAVSAIARETGCPVYLCEADLALPPRLTAGELYYTHAYGEGDVLQLAGLTVHVLHTPGHTMGSVCLKIEDCLFTGDTLFAGSCGRTDLGGDWDTITRSLKRLAALETELRVFPGHGIATLLSREKEYNRFMR